MGASMKYYKTAIESAIQDAENNGYSVDVVNDCCGCSSLALEIASKDGLDGPQVIHWHG